MRATFIPYTWATCQNIYHAEMNHALSSNQVDKIFCCKTVEAASALLGDTGCSEKCILAYPVYILLASGDMYVVHPSANALVEELLRPPEDPFVALAEVLEHHPLIGVRPVIGVQDFDSM